MKNKQNGAGENIIGKSLLFVAAASLLSGCAALTAPIEIKMEDTVQAPPTKKSKGNEIFKDMGIHLEKQHNTFHQNIHKNIEKLDEEHDNLNHDDCDQIDHISHLQMVLSHNKMQHELECHKKDLLESGLISLEEMQGKIDEAYENVLEQCDNLK